MEADTAAENPQSAELEKPVPEMVVAEVVVTERAAPPVRWREIAAVLLMIVLADVTIYRGAGFAGYGAFFLGAPLLLWIGAPKQHYGKSFFLVGLMLLLLVARLVWCGSTLAVASGFALLVAFAMSLVGLCPYVLETIVFASQTIMAGFEGLNQYCRTTNRAAPNVARGAWLSVALPAAAFIAFGLLFIVANPDLLDSFGETVRSMVDAARQWILDFSPAWQEIVFWLFVLWMSVGLLRPVVTRSLLEESSGDAAEGGESVEALLYRPFRNTLVTVILLFGVYLVFEFQTLWFREFPAVFHYSGYAHEGAAWLTVALGLSTLILSLIFRGNVLHDTRLPRLRRLAWIWSLENLVLAAAVYNRLGIYVGFNGMTWMRTVGLFGMTCVVVGFILVVWKIVHNRDFIWLMRRHLWALALAVYLFALTPIDTLVHTYNVNRILSGDPAPSVQISVHPISTEGVLVLLPLVECDDPIIRDGVRALLADRLAEAETQAQRQQGWTAYQMADERMLGRLRAESSRWAEYADRPTRDAARTRFDDYAYRWY